MRTLPPVWLAATLIVSGADAPQTKPRQGDFLRAKAKARAWFDALPVDTAELMRHGVKGKKKLTEILDVYLDLHRHSKDPADREAILKRVKGLVEQTAKREYHDMGSLGEAEFTQNSMSYLRTAWLMKQFGLDIDGYLKEVRAMKPRLDAHMRSRGPWQRAMFAEYYDRFGLEKPKELLDRPMEAGVISRRLPFERYDSNATYDLTHEVFVAFDYGLSRQQTRFSKEDLAYTKEVLPRLVDRFVGEHNPDLVAELLSGMTFLGWHDEPAYGRGIDYLLGAQRENGSWGDYEKYRPQFGKYLEQHVYLHTTMVVMQALLEVFEGEWPAAKG